jgi:hypothetical protein
MNADLQTATKTELLCLLKARLFWTRHGGFNRLLNDVLASNNAGFRAPKTAKKNLGSSTEPSCGLFASKPNWLIATLVNFFFS